MASSTDDAARGVLRIRRDHELDNGTGKYKIFVDGKEVATVKHRGEAIIEVRPGVRRVQAFRHWPHYSSAVERFDVAAGQTLDLVVRLASPLCLMGAANRAPDPFLAFDVIDASARTGAERDDGLSTRSAMSDEAGPAGDGRGAAAGGSTLAAPVAVLGIGVAIFLAGQLFAYRTSLSGPADANIGAGLIALVGALTALVGLVLLMGAGLRRRRRRR